MAETIPVLNWTQIGSSFLAWIDGKTFYTLKPVVYVDDEDSHGEWELRIETVGTGTAELIGVYDKPEAAYVGAREHVGDA